MKYLFCTIAVGEKYLCSAENIAKSLNKYSNKHHMMIVTDIFKENFTNTFFKTIPEGQIIFINSWFNYTLKYYPLYLSNSMEYDFIIFIDADWRILEKYNSKKIEELLQFMDDNEYDMFFERPHKIGDGKFDDYNCFWKHKRDFYNLLNTTEFDEGHVCNEQFIIFRKNEKFNLFVNKFKELYELSSKAQLWPFAEGLEMGMSMAYSKMKIGYKVWEPYLKEMFEFTAKNNQIYTRY